MALPLYASTGQRVWYYTFRVICGLLFFFLIFPIMVIIPLSFNAQDFFTFTPEMLSFSADGFSLKHVRVPARVEIGEGGDAERGGVTGHVPAIRQQRHGAENETGGNFQHHHRGRQGNHQPGTALIGHLGIAYNNVLMVPGVCIVRFQFLNP